MGHTGKMSVLLHLKHWRLRHDAPGVEGDHPLVHSLELYISRRMRLVNTQIHMCVFPWTLGFLSSIVQPRHFLLDETLGVRRGLFFVGNESCLSFWFVCQGLKEARTFVYTPGECAMNRSATSTSCCLDSQVVVVHCGQKLVWDQLCSLPVESSYSQASSDRCFRASVYEYRCPHAYFTLIHAWNWP